MALPSTLHRFDLDLSDVDRGVYETCALRVARHPSESTDFLITRVLAYLLELQEGLAFGRGLCAADEPAIHLTDATGRLRLWVDVGNPSPERIHKAAKLADRVAIYTYKDLDLLLRSVEGQRVHRGETIEACALPRELLADLAGRLDRNNTWTVVHTEGTLYVTVGASTFEGGLRRERLA